VSSPILCNQSPYPATIGKVTSSVRFSLRDDTYAIDRPTILAHLGYSTAHYESGELPENIITPRFVLDRLFGVSDGEVTRAIDGDYLKITKSGDPNDNLNGLYFFGGVDSPMDQDDPLMMEVKLKLSEADISPAPSPVNDFTGVVFGFFINDTGLFVRFYTDGVSRWIEIFDGDQNSTQRPLHPATTYLANFDWDAVEYNYKLLWDTRRDKVQLLVSVGEESFTTDTLLIDGQVSDFPTIPDDQQRTGQPLAFFGHGFEGTNSISYWKAVYFYNYTGAMIGEGLFQGEHEGFILTDNETAYSQEKLPRDEDRPWLIFPGTYDDIDGTEELKNDYLILTREDLEASFGFYRVEPRVAALPTLVDFSLYGDVSDQESGMQTSGFEVYVDDGTNAARVGFTDNLVKKTVGVLGTGDQKLQGSYSGLDIDWTSEFRYRFIFDPGYGAKLFRMLEDDTDGHLYYSPISDVLLANLPSTSLPGPSVGFGHNGVVGKAKSEFYIGEFRYYTNLRLYDARDGLTPQAPWSKVGSGPTSIDTDDDALVIGDDSDSAFTRYEKAESDFNSGRGITTEFSVKVDAYSLGTTESPVRENTGVGVVLDDGTYKTVLSFADGGPELGKIVFISTEDDIDDTLFNIRAGTEDTDGIYYSVDWTRYHIYRLEKTIGGYLRLYIDNGESPAISFLTNLFDYPNTEGGGSKVAFGSLLDGNECTSRWRFFNFNVSEGFDIKASQVLDEDELLQRFDHEANIIASFENIGP